MQQQHWAFTRWGHHGARTQDLLQDEWRLELGSVVMETLAASWVWGPRGLKASQEGTSNPSDGLGDQRAARGCTPLLMGWGGEPRLELQVQERKVSSATDATVPLPSPTTRPPSSQEITVSRKTAPSHHEESLAHAKGLELDGGKVNT